MRRGSSEEPLKRTLSEALDKEVSPGTELWPAICRRLDGHPSEVVQPRRSVPHGGRPVTTALLSGLLAAVVLFGLVWKPRVTHAHAQEIVEETRTALVRDGLLQIRSYAATQKTIWTTDSGTVSVETKRWYKAPGYWRVESEEISGQADREGAVSMVVTDGVDVWEQHDDTVTISRATSALTGTELTPWGSETAKLADLLDQVSAYYNPRVRGEDTVAGRRTYVLDLGEPTRRSSSAPEWNGRRVIWVDTETFFLLKAVQYSPAGDRIVGTLETTSITYDLSLDPGLFSYSPPLGATVFDFRPQPVSTEAQFAHQAEELAKGLDYPLFVPRHVPEGLIPRGPLPALRGIEISYVPVDEVETEKAAILSGVVILQRKPTAEDVSKLSERTEAVSLGGTMGWYAEGARRSNGARSTNTLSVLKGGTLITLTSFEVKKDALVQMAASLELVKGGHPPLPNPAPTQLSLADLRRNLPFPVFVPTRVPSAAAPTLSTTRDTMTPFVRIEYRTEDRSTVLDVLVGPAGSGLAADQRKTGEALTIRHGVSGHFLPNQPEFGGPILWWEESGAYVALSGPHLSKNDLLLIAESVSPTAELEPVE